MSDQCPTCGHPVSVRGSDEGTMHYVPSDKAQEAAQRVWDATHSLHSAVSAGCRVQIQEIVERLRELPAVSGPHAVADLIEREYGGLAAVEAQYRLDAKAAAEERERGEL